MPLSEDDIRTKIVYEWLKDCGLSTGQLYIEYSINLQIGKGTKTIHSRTDILVKSDNGKNILIIEVKKPDHKLSKGDEDQAISYAWAVKGDIAPFTVLTNGKETKIFDSVSKVRMA